MAKPSEPTNVEVGAPLSGVVGGTGAALDVVGRSGSPLFTQTLTDLAMMNFVVNIAQQMGAINPAPMEPGVTGVGTALGTNADMYGQPGSEFASTMADQMVKFGVMATLFNLANMNTGPTPEVVKQLQAEDEQRKAAIALDQAQKAEAIADGDRKRAASFTAPKM